MPRTRLSPTLYQCGVAVSSIRCDSRQRNAPLSPSVSRYVPVDLEYARRSRIAVTERSRRTGDHRHYRSLRVRRCSEPAAVRPTATSTISPGASVTCAGSVTATRCPCLNTSMGPGMSNESRCGSRRHPPSAYPKPANSFHPRGRRPRRHVLERVAQRGDQPVSGAGASACDPRARVTSDSRRLSRETAFVRLEPHG